MDNRETLTGIVEALDVISKKIQTIFPIHQRTKKMLTQFDLNLSENVKIIQPLSYLEFLNLEENATFVLTDSSSIQVETTVFSVPCLTIRRNTERPATIENGTNILVGIDKDRIIRESRNILEGQPQKASGKYPFCDGKARIRIVGVLRNAN